MKRKPQKLSRKPYDYNKTVKGCKAVAVFLLEVKDLYLYPDNLKSKATLWLWQLRDIGIIGGCAVVAILLLTQVSLISPLVLTGVFAFLTIRFEDTSILDFIRYACGFLFISQQLYEWSYMGLKED